jgi:hypothetical protein
MKRSNENKDDESGDHCAMKNALKITKIWIAPGL